MITYFKVVDREDLLEVVFKYRCELEEPAMQRPKGLEPTKLHRKKEIGLIIRAPHNHHGI